MNSGKSLGILTINEGSLSTELRELGQVNQEKFLGSDFEARFER